MAITLTKGQRIDLKKQDGAKLTNFCVGVNWGAIVTKGGFLRASKTTNVDLDLSCIVIDDQNNMCDFLYSPLYQTAWLAQRGLRPGKLKTEDNALQHSGDDLQGDKGGDDGLDNEIITVDLSKISSKATQIFFFLNNVNKEDFSQIPYAKIRMYDGTPKLVKEVVASYNVAAEPQYSGKRAMIMGKLYKRDGTWKFNAIGEPTNDDNFTETIKRILTSYVRG